MFKELKHVIELHREIYKHCIQAKKNNILMKAENMSSLFLLTG